MRIALVLLALLASPAFAQEWEAISHSPDGLFVGFMPRAIAVGLDGDVYLPATCVACAGPFDGIARWDAQTSTWGPIELVPGQAANALPMATSLDGSIYVAIQTNDPIVVGGVSLAGLARYDPTTETWDGLESGLPAGFGTSNLVYDVEVGTDGRVYVGGEFKASAGGPADHIAAWDPVTRTWDDLGGGPGARVFHLAVAADGTVYANGVFSLSGTTALYAVYDPVAGTWTGLPLDVYGSSEGIAVDRATGTFYTAGALRGAGNARFPLASYDGGGWTPLGTPGPITTVASGLLWDPAGALYVSGYLGPVGGIPTSAIERLDLVTGTWTEVAGGVAGEVEAMAPAPGGEVAVAGNFATVSTTAVGDRDVAAPGVAVSDAVAGWRSLGSSVAGSGAQGDAPTVVRGLAATPDGTSIYAVGLFETAGGTVVDNVARWDAASRSWNALGDGVLGGGNDVAVGADGGVYFSNAGVGHGLLRWDPAAETWSNVTGLEGYVRRFDQTLDGRLLLTGLSAAGGTPTTSTGVVLYDPVAGTYDVLEGGPPVPSGTLVGYAATGDASGTLYVGRSVYDGGVRGEVSRFDPTTRTWTSLPTPPTPPAMLRVGPDGALYLAGGSSLPDSGVLRYDGSAWVKVGTNTPRVAESLSFAPGGQLLVSADGGILQYDATSNAFTTIGVLGGQGGTTVPASFAYDADGALLLGGRFHSVSGVYSPRVARWTGNFGPTSVAHGPDGSLGLSVFPNPTAGRLHLGATLSEAGPVRVTLHDALGRTVAVLAEGVRAAGPLAVITEVGGLAPGVYVVRLETAGHVESRRVVLVR